MTPLNTSNSTPSTNGAAITNEITRAQPTALTQAVLIASRAIASATDRQSLVTALADHLNDVAIDFYSLMRFCGVNGAELELVATWDRNGPPPLPIGARFPRAAYPSIDRITSTAPVIYNDCTTDPGLDEATRRMVVDTFGTLSSGVFPLVERGTLIGVFSVNYRTLHPFTQEDIGFFDVIAQLSAVAVANIESREQLAANVQRVHRFYRISEALEEYSDEDELLHAAAALLVREIGYPLSWIALVDPAAGVLRGHSAAGLLNEDSARAMTYPLNASDRPVVAILRSGQPHVHTDVAARTNDEPWSRITAASDLRSMIDVPLRAAGEAVGLLTIGNTDDQVAEDDVSLLAAFANQLASAVMRIRLDGDRARQVEALKEAYAEQLRLLETVRDLSTPVIPVHDGILVVPLVGHIDTSRSNQVMDTLLTAVQRERTAVVILDITGVPIVDTGVANHLLQATRAASLLGATCVLVGITPEVAQTVVQLGVDLGGLVTRSNLQSGISYALHRLHLQISSTR
jgi:GAF domain-containing protein